MFIPSSVKRKYNEDILIENKKVKSESSSKTQENKKFSLFSYAFDDKEDNDENESDNDSDSVVEFSRNQRYPKEGEPVCVVCGRYGEYICDETNKDVCSLECKKKHLELFKHSKSISEEEEDKSIPPTEIVNYIEHEEINKLAEEQVERIRNSLLITVKGNNIPKPILQFIHCNFPDKIMENMKLENYLTPTPIQMQAIPVLLSHRNCVICSPTGSGKSLSFILPSIVTVNIKYPQIQSILQSSQSSQSSSLPIILIITPTRELAMQIEIQIKSLVKGYNNYKTALLVGGEAMPVQIYRLKQKEIQFVIGTPGRILDILHSQQQQQQLEEKEGDNMILYLSFISTLIIDEIDTLLKTGFENQINEIMSFLPKEKQIVLVSATIPPNTEKYANKNLNDAIFIKIGDETTQVNEVIEQHVIWAEEKSKKNKLFEIIQNPLKYKPPMVVFVDNKIGTELLSEAITTKTGIPSTFVHGDLKQDERVKALNSFLSGVYDIIVSTSLLGRGLDLLKVQTVVNFDMPNNINDYVHQIGRAGRLGQKGYAYSFVNQKNEKLFFPLVQILKDSGFVVPHQILNNKYYQSKVNHAKIEKPKAKISKTPHSADPVYLHEWKKWQEKHNS